MVIMNANIVEKGEGVAVEIDGIVRELSDYYDSLEWVEKDGSRRPVRPGDDVSRMVWTPRDEFLDIDTVSKEKTWSLTLPKKQIHILPELLEFIKTRWIEE